MVHIKLGEHRFILGRRYFSDEQLKKLRHQSTRATMKLDVTKWPMDRALGEVLRRDYTAAIELELPATDKSAFLLRSVGCELPWVPCGENLLEALSSSVDILELSTRVQKAVNNCASRLGIGSDYVWQVATIPVFELMRTRNFGRKAKSEFAESLQDLGLTPGMDKSLMRPLGDRLPDYSDF